MFKWGGESSLYQSSWAVCFIMPVRETRGLPERAWACITGAPQPSLPLNTLQFTLVAERYRSVHTEKAFHRRDAKIGAERLAGLALMRIDQIRAECPRIVIIFLGPDGRVITEERLRMLHYELCVEAQNRYQGA